MTREEVFAIALRERKAITHRFFSDHEYIYVLPGMVVTEEGYKCPLETFLNDRQGAYWETDWSLFNEQGAG
jgi:hypothetical protein